MPEVRDDPVDIVRREGGLGRVQFAGHLDLGDDRAEGAESRHIARLALAGSEVCRLRQVVKYSLRLFPFGDADLTLAHAVILDIRVEGSLRRFPCVVLDVLVVQYEALFQSGIVIIQIIQFTLGVEAVPLPAEDLFPVVLAGYVWSGDLRASA